MERRLGDGGGRGDVSTLLEILLSLHVQRHRLGGVEAVSTLLEILPTY